MIRLVIYIAILLGCATCSHRVRVKPEKVIYEFAVGQAISDEMKVNDEPAVKIQSHIAITDKHLFIQNSNKALSLDIVHYAVKLNEIVVMAEGNGSRALLIMLPNESRLVVNYQGTIIRVVFFHRLDIKGVPVCTIRR